MRNPNALANAVHKVIEQNKSVGYSPNRFIVATEGGNAANLPQICEGLICKQENLEWIENAIKKYPVRTLEDEVVDIPNGLGLSPSAIRSAQRRVEWFNKLRKIHGTMPPSC